MAVCQNLVPLVNIKIAGKWMFIPLKIVLIGIDPYPHCKPLKRSTPRQCERRAAAKPFSLDDAAEDGSGDARKTGEAHDSCCRKQWIEWKIYRK